MARKTTPGPEPRPAATGDPRKLTEKFKIPGRSLPEIVGRFSSLITRQQNEVGRTFGDRKVSGEAITNAIVLHFLGLPPGEQDQILDRSLPELAGLIAATTAREGR